MKNTGYDILEAKNYKVTDTYTQGICLGKHENQNYPPRFVTWEYTENLKTGKFTFYWGHYFDSENDAYKDYYTRLANRYDLPWEG